MGRGDAVTTADDLDAVSTRVVLSRLDADEDGVFAWNVRAKLHGVDHYDGPFTFTTAELVAAALFNFEGVSEVMAIAVEVTP